MSIANIRLVIILNYNKTPLLSGRKAGNDIPHAMALNDNKIDYVHWDDPNEFVDHL